MSIHSKTIIISPDNKKGLALLRQLKADFERRREYLKNGGELGKPFPPKPLTDCQPHTASNVRHPHSPGM